MTRTTKTMLRYPGGKSRAVKKLLPMIPEGTTTAVAPFLGGGSFELAMTGEGIEVYGSDLFSQLATFWTVMIDTPKLLSDQLETYLGKIDKDTFLSFQKNLREESETDLQIATWFYIVNRCSFSGATLSGGFSQSASTGRFTQSSVDRVRNFDNDLFHVSESGYEDALDRLADFYFLDPPYLLGGSRDSLYGNRGDMHESFNHVEFRDRVKEIESPVLITYNNTDEIRDLWVDDRWTVVETSWAYGMNASKKSSEIIICNY